MGLIKWLVSTVLGEVVGGLVQGWNAERQRQTTFDAGATAAALNAANERLRQAAAFGEATRAVQAMSDEEIDRWL